MKKTISFLMLTCMIITGTCLLFLGTGCEDQKGICDTEQTIHWLPGFDKKYLESWRKEGTFGILRFTYTDRMLTFLCTEKTIYYQGKLQKANANTSFTVPPQARLIWKYGAPKPSKTILMGVGSFNTLFGSNTISTTFYENRISLAYTTSAYGGYFIPGVEIKIATRGNQTDDYDYVWNNFLLVFDYYVKYYEI
jgi:hypothetical protein